MASINRIPFKDVKGAGLFVDTVYEGGTDNNISSEVISKLLHVRNLGGFRKCMSTNDGKKTKTVAYVCIYTSGEEPEWRDELDRTLGRFIYWGDNRKGGNPLLKTQFGGNAFLEDIFSKLSDGSRENIPPVFVFQKPCGYDKYCGYDVMFSGLAVPGDRRINPQDALVTIWAQNKDGRYQNYKSIFTIFDIPFIDPRWLDDLEQGFGYQSEFAPKVWKEWVDKGKYTPLITEKNPIQYRKAIEQLPEVGTLEFSMLDRIIYFFDDPYAFEQFACKLVQIMDSNIVSIEQTQRTRDGGRDAVGQYRVGLATGGIELEFALEAKRYSIKNSVGVKETSRLISRIKHRQFGIFVTTSYVGDQAYKEIVEDQHPIIIISGKDIVDILISAGINSVELLDEWLEINFDKHQEG